MPRFQNSKVEDDSVEWICGLPFHTVPNNRSRIMTYEQAKRILHPDTTLETLAEIEYYAGFNGEEAKRKAVDEACLVACEALDKCMNRGD